MLSTRDRAKLKKDIRIVQDIVRYQIIFETKKLMHEYGLTRSGLARLMDVPFSTVNSWMSEEHNFKIDTLTKLAFKLGKIPSITFVDLVEQ